MVGATGSNPVSRTTFWRTRRKPRCALSRIEPTRRGNWQFEWPGSEDPLQCSGSITLYGILTFVESPQFTAQIPELLSDDDYRAFQLDLAGRPDQGDVIPGLGGLRKVRMAAKGKGKRGGARVIYLHLPGVGIIYLFYVYTKGDITDLPPNQKKRLIAAVQEIKSCYTR
jgi:mRNA-degrading endonuclease RelE of RelBE toxin-antitoxin system